VQRLLDICLRSLICDFKDDFQLNWNPNWEAGNANNQSNRCLFAAKDIPKEIRCAICDSGLVKEVPGGCDEHAKANNTSYSVE
jgi:hypothetical protein